MTHVCILAEPPPLTFGFIPEHSAPWPGGTGTARSPKNGVPTPSLPPPHILPQGFEESGRWWVGIPQGFVVEGDFQCHLVLSFSGSSPLPSSQKRDHVASVWARVLSQWGSGYPGAWLALSSWSLLSAASPPLKGLRSPPARVSALAFHLRPPQTWLPTPGPAQTRSHVFPSPLGLTLFSFVL